jgi:hypothetical protein
MVYVGNPCGIDTIVDSIGRHMVLACQDKIFAIDTNNESTLKETLLTTGIIEDDDNTYSYEIIDDSMISINRNNKKFLYMAIRHRY